MNNSRNNKAVPRSALHYLHRLLSVCSTRCLFRLARLLALVIANTGNQISRQSRENIALCFPHYGAAQQARLVRQSIIHTCCAFLELGALWQQPINRILGLVEIEQLAANYPANDKPSIVVAPHHGSWELLNYWLAQQGNFFAVYKPARNRSLDQYILSSRSRNGAHLVPTGTAGMRQLMRGLKNRASCMILPDQRPSRSKARITSQFFQQPAATSLLIKNLLDRIECNVFIAVMTRDLDSGRYRLRLEQLDGKQLTADAEASALYLNQAIESIVQHDLSQYQWAYRRFDEAAYRHAGP